MQTQSNFIITGQTTRYNERKRDRVIYRATLFVPPCGMVIKMDNSEITQGNENTRIALLSIIVENAESVEKLNGILHEYSDIIIGRMGLPYPRRKVSIISVALDAPSDTINALTGKVGALKGVSAKTTYSRV